MNILSPFRFFWKVYALGRARRGAAYLPQAVDCWRLFRLNGIEPTEYFDYDLAEPTLPWSEKVAFMSYNQTAQLDRVLNPASQRTILERRPFAKRMQSCELPTPSIYCALRPHGESGGDPDVLASEWAFLAFLDSRDIKSFVIKFTRYSSKGFAVTVITDRTAEILVTAQGQQVKVSALWQSLSDLTGPGGAYAGDDIIIQERVVQHQELARIYPTATNTLRVITLLHENGEVEIIALQMKFGSGGQMVDNVSQGGMPTAVTHDGVLGAGLKFTPAGVEYFPIHPDTGQAIAGFTLPHFELTCETAKRAQKAIPELRALAWDIAITENGPTIIEGNTHWGAWPQAHIRRGMMNDSFRAVLVDSKWRR